MTQVASRRYAHRAEPSIEFPKIPPAVSTTLLTNIELQVARLLAEGLTAKEIARNLQRSEKTIEHQRSEVYAKLGIDNVVVLTRWAVACGLVAAVPYRRRVPTVRG